jgi:hypothetical protein
MACPTFLFHFGLGLIALFFLILILDAPLVWASVCAVLLSFLGMSGLFAPVAGLEVVRDDSFESLDGQSVGLRLSTISGCFSSLLLFLL